MKTEIRDLARVQEGLVAHWQLRNLGLSRNAIAHHARQLRRLHNGVYLTGEAPVTQRQRWFSATLTAPNTLLAGHSAGAAWGMWRWDGPHTVVLRPGNGGPKRFGPLLVRRSTIVTPDGTLRDRTDLDGLPITTAERTIADLWPRAGSERAQRKMLREALRLRRTTTAALRQHLDAAPSRVSPRSLSALLHRYERLQLHRCRSDAEAYAAELIDAARLPVAQINVRVAGEEADLSWPGRRLVIEIDGDQFHLDKAEDARKTAIWTAAGWTVRRAHADLVFGDPARFTAGVRHYLAST